ncbi:MAG: helix-turn-helix domain-containing protein [Mycobacterium sp.]
MDTLLLRESVPVERTSVEKILDAAMSVIAQHGVEATSFRRVSEAAGVSTGLVQHYFKTKSDLVEATDRHFLETFARAVEAVPLPEHDPISEAGRRLVTLFATRSEMMDYVTRSLVEGGAAGNTVFDWMFQLSDRQSEHFDEMDLLRPDLDEVWGVMLPVLVRTSAFILSHHINRYLPEPLRTPEQLQRWDSAVTKLLRHGQFKQDAPDLP